MIVYYLSLCLTTPVTYWLSQVWGFKGQCVIFLWYAYMHVHINIIATKCIFVFDSILYTFCICMCIYLASSPIINQIKFYYIPNTFSKTKHIVCRPLRFVWKMLEQIYRIHKFSGYENWPMHCGLFTDELLVMATSVCCTSRNFTSLTENGDRLSSGKLSMFVLSPYLLTANLNTMKN